MISMMFQSHRISELDLAWLECIAALAGKSAEVAIWRAAHSTGVKLPLWREEILDREYGDRLGDAAVDAWRCIDPGVVA